MAAQAVEAGKGLQRELTSLQDNYEQACPSILLHTLIPPSVESLRIPT